MKKNKGRIVLSRMLRQSSCLRFCRFTRTLHLLKAGRYRVGLFHRERRGTASGQKFNPGGSPPPIAHLPFGTKVRVTNKKNGHSVVVTINDRGPFVSGRVIDVTRPERARSVSPDYSGQSRHPRSRPRAGIATFRRKIDVFQDFGQCVQQGTTRRDGRRGVRA